MEKVCHRPATYEHPQDLIGHPDRWEFMQSQILTTPPTALARSSVDELTGDKGLEDDGFTKVVSKKTWRKRKQSQAEKWTSY